MGNNKEKIDTSILPEEAKRELIDFYIFLVERYGKKQINKKFYKENKIMKNKKEKFLRSLKERSFNIPEGFKFNREELHER